MDLSDRHSHRRRVALAWPSGASGLPWLLDLVDRKACRQTLASAHRWRWLRRGMTLTSAPSASHLCLERRKEIRQREAECCRQPSHAVQADLAFTTFYRPDIVSMQVGAGSQFFLRDGAGQAEFPDSGTDRLSNIAAHDHNRVQVDPYGLHTIVCIAWTIDFAHFPQIPIEPPDAASTWTPTSIPTCLTVTVLSARRPTHVGARTRARFMKLRLTISDDTSISSSTADHCGLS